MSICRLSSLIAVAAVLLVPLPATAAERPNIVLCMADDQGWGDMAYYGHPHLKTPVFDEMARTGLRLDRFYAAAPVCSPTRGSVMTGRTPNRYGVFSWGHSLRPQEITIAEAVRAAGYATGHFGKWHLGSVMPDSPLSPGANGFDEWLSAANFFDVNPWLSDRSQAAQIQGEGSEIIVDAALKFIHRQQAAKLPFLAVVWFGSPHSPHVGLEADLALYADQPEKQRRFLAEITAMDRAMGRLRDGLRESGLAGNTLLWYCSDNGAIPEGSTGGLRGKKGQIYEGGLRVPSLVEWPARIKTPRRSDFPCGTVDIYPTVLELAGAKPAHQPVLDGQSLVPLFDGTATNRDRPLGFWESGIAGFGTPSDKLIEFLAARQKDGAPIPADHAVRGLPPAPLAWEQPAGSFAGHAAWLDGNWKLHRIENKNNGKVRWELYDLATDPKEANDVSSQESARTARMKSELETWLSSVTASLRGEDYSAP
jgi:arylsulfatase A-like enzyme